MALTFTPRPLNQDASNKVTACSLFCTVTSVTLDNTYATGGVALTPQQLGLTGAVYFATANTRTSAGNVSEASLDCTNPAAPKLKLQASATTTAELGATLGSGSIIDIMAFGY